MRLHRWRHLVQLVVVAVVAVTAVRHQIGGSREAASVDAMCPFGAVETLYSWSTTGTFVTQTHPSNLVLGGALLASVVLAGNAFCGWICPFGAVQDALTWLRKTLNLPTLRVPARLDATLRYGRFVVLAVAVVVSAQTLHLWFSDFDPYLTLFALDWLFAPELSAIWVGLAVLVVVLALSLLVERAWCRYLCPLGGVLSVLGHFSLLRVRRNPSACTGCDLCVAPCPVGIDVAKATSAVSADCIGCLECVAQCPKGGALEVQAALPWPGQRTMVEGGVS